MKILKKIKGIYSKIKKHPIVKQEKGAALLRYLKFNAIASFDNRPRIYKWVNGLKFIAQKGDAGIVPNIYFKLFDYEDSIFILDTLNSDSVFVDIGANVGHFTLLAASCNAEVYSFEPIPATFKKLEANIMLNKLSINLNNLGIGEKTDYLYFTQNLGVMNRVEFKENENTVKVKTIRLDDFPFKKKPTFIKIDVEGFEWFVLKGAENVLASTELKYVLIEINNSGRKFSIDNEQIHSYLLQKGFSPYCYNYDSKQLERIDSYRKDKFNTLYVKN